MRYGMPFIANGFHGSKLNWFPVKGEIVCSHGCGFEIQCYVV
jgi:hypothetical protein